MLYSRDYNKLTDEEIKKKEDIDEKTQRKEGDFIIQDASAYLMYPKAVRHNESLFPNYFLDIADLHDFENLERINEEYLSFITKNRVSETEIKNFIIENQYYHIIGSLFKRYYFGHHGAFLFPEFLISDKYRADYLLVGDSSDGFQFVFVEMQSAYKGITISNGEYFGIQMREGLNQVTEWKREIIRNYESISERFNKYKNPSFNLPQEFVNLDHTRLSFAIIVGMRKDYTEAIRYVKREYSKGLSINYFHYENLYDFSNELINNNY